MYDVSTSTLLTCRYWAFGPQCPDIDQNGTQRCRFAHWDTGRLSHFDDQRGTCRDWFYGRNCRFVANCMYEHRDTGMMGMGQGGKTTRNIFTSLLTTWSALELYGLNLQVADAASRAGFDTRNHVALMDLIWAVRRIAYCGGTQYGSKQRPPPPPHPIYPDKYRPGDPWLDNTKNPKKRTRDVSVAIFVC